MTRSRKRKRVVNRRDAPKRKNQRFNPVLETLSSFKTRLSRDHNPTMMSTETGSDQKEPDDSRLFLEAMSDVKPLEGGNKKVTPVPNLHVRPPHPAPDEDMEAMAHLSELVAGNAQIDITFTDEYMEGAIQGFNRKLMQKLKRGEFPIQDHVDLHGLSKEQAKATLHNFLIQSYRQGLRSVLVVHGRGLNSENHVPVIKKNLPVWLSRGTLRKVVLAFATARIYDGGPGAIYLLLRKAK